MPATKVTPSGTWPISGSHWASMSALGKILNAARRQLSRPELPRHTLAGDRTTSATNHRSLVEADGTAEAVAVPENRPLLGRLVRLFRLSGNSHNVNKRLGLARILRPKVRSGSDHLIVYSAPDNTGRVNAHAYLYATPVYGF